MESVYRILGERKPRKLKARQARKLAAAPSAIPLPPLPAIADARFLLPGNADYATYLPLHNKRNDVAPALRIVCTSTQAVSDCVKWVRDNNLPLALRCGGHCYEGFSQSAGVVIDLRRMGLVTVDAARKMVTVSGGANLGKIYRAVADKGFAFAGGSCPTVGVAGHALGGGQGLLGRRFGLACDNLLSIKIVDANGVIKVADAVNNSDLFWACKGGGGGSFGVATGFKFRIHELTHVRTFRIGWKFPNTGAGRTRAAQVFDAWQKWAPSAPRNITAIMKVQKASDGQLSLRVIGQSTGSRAELESELNTHLIVRPPTSALEIVRKTFMAAIESFAGSFDYESTYMKAKSDFVTTPLTAAAMQTLFTGLLAIPAGHVAALCDPYGGAISDVAPSASAFPRRGANTYCIQYYSRWANAADTQTRLQRITNVYDAMRPFMPGKAYVNYCDIDQANFAASYWGGNLPRLKQVKAAQDAANFFRHAQSVPLP
ncbi:MAG: FAD-binding oxidoreductase [Rhizobiales bacterium]|nr:FAD-binding oxidoreductase [Hyphomicrobiales bacterium]